MPTGARHRHDEFVGVDGSPALALRAEDREAIVELLVSIILADVEAAGLLGESMARPAEAAR